MSRLQELSASNTGRGAEKTGVTGTPAGALHVALHVAPGSGLETPPPTDVNHYCRCSKWKQLYLSLQVERHHGETEVKQEVLLLEALQGSAHPEGHHVGPLEEQRGAEDLDSTQTHDTDEADLQPRTGVDQACGRGRLASLVLLEELTMK